MRRAAALLACALACAVSPAVARGAEASAAELRSLARSALRDEGALARLREIDVVDGRPARVGAALSGTQADVRGRLLALAQEGAAAAVAPDRAREQARDVLAQRRFRPSTVAAPLRSLRERIGAALRSLGRPFEAAFHWIAGWLPGGPPALLALIAAATLGAAAALAARAGARRAGAGSARAADRAGGEERPSAARLREQADGAERRGELDAALRLRFRAGLVELDSRELIELRPALTNRELLRAVRSPTLAGLVDGFEAVAYGGRAAAADDLRRARDGWPRVVDEAATR